MNRNLTIDKKDQIMKHPKAELLCEGIKIICINKVYYVFDNEDDLSFGGHEAYMIISSSRNRAVAIENALKSLASCFFKTRKLVKDFVEKLDINSNNSPIEFKLLHDNSNNDQPFSIIDYDAESQTYFFSEGFIITHQ